MPHKLPLPVRYSFSNPRLTNFGVQLICVILCKTLSGALPGVSASISRVTRTFHLTNPTS